VKKDMKFSPLNKKYRLGDVKSIKSLVLSGGKYRVI